MVLLSDNKEERRCPMLTHSYRPVCIDVDATQLTTKDGKKLSWIQCMPFGSWEHPFYGTLKFDMERAKRFAKNFENNVVSKELDIDFEHKLFDGQAAGWVRAAEARENEGLYLQIEWTPAGEAAIRNGSYKYFSPEFFDEWEHPQSGAKFTDVLMGGGLTNRPFLKGIAAVNLSELVPQSGDKMTQPNPAAGPPQSPATQLTAEALGKLLNDNPDLIKNLPVVKELSDTVATQAKTIEGLEETNKTLSTAAQTASVEVQLTDFAKGDVQLSSKAVDLAREILLTAPKALADKFIEFAKAVQDGSAVVELRERGGANPASGGNGDAIKQFTDAVAKVQTEHKLSYLEAAKKVSSENPDLHKSYMEATLERS
jgi:phage I-like protein